MIATGHAGLLFVIPGRSQPAAAAQPTSAEVSHAHMGGDAFMTVPDVERSERDSLRYRLA